MRVGRQVSLPRKDQCGCRYTKQGKRMRCDLHQNKYVEPKRPTYYPMSPERILALGKGIDDATAQAIFFFLYLTGGRINEVADMAPSRIQELQDRYVIRIKTLKQRKGDNIRRIPIPKGKAALCCENEMMEIVMRYVGGFSNMDKPFKKWNGPYGTRLYLRRKIPELTLEARVKTVTGEYIDKEITKPFHPHYLRHARASHLVDFYRFDTAQLCAFFGWKNPAMALRYTKYLDIWKAFSPS